MTAGSIPEGFHSLTPFLMAEGVPRLLDFLKEAFGAVETERLTSPDGMVRHAEMRIGDSMLMLAEACQPRGPTPADLYHYVEDVDAVYARAIEAGAESVDEPQDQFYGDRACGVRDPSGNTWWIATRIENLTHEEIVRRAEALSGDA